MVLSFRGQELQSAARLAERDRRALHVLVLVVEADGYHGVVRQVGLQNAVADFPLQRVVVAKGLAVTVSHHRAPAQPSVKRQRAAHIQVAVVVVMAGAADAGLGLPLRRRALADHVDGRRGVAGTGRQAGGAAYYFDTVVDDGVRVGLHAPERIEHAVHLEVIDRITPGGIPGPVRIQMLDRHAGGLAQSVGQGIEIEIVHLLAGDHRNGLRRFLDRQVQPGGGTHRAGGIGPGVLGIGTQAFGADVGAAQLQRGGGCLFGVGFSQQFRAQRQAEQAEGNGHGTGKGREHRGRLLVVFAAFSV